MNESAQDQGSLSEDKPEEDNVQRPRIKPTGPVKNVPDTELSTARPSGGSSVGPGWALVVEGLSPGIDPYGRVLPPCYSVSLESQRKYRIVHTIGDPVFYTYGICNIGSFICAIQFEISIHSGVSL